MKTQRITAATIALAAIATITPATTAHALDWIERVKVERSGIDMVPVDVRAGGNGYSSLKTGSHTFNLRLYAKAKSGKRIAMGAVGSYNGVRRWEASSLVHWTHNLRHRDLGAGTLRTMDRTFSYTVPLSKVTWHGANPAQACNALLSKAMNKGTSKAAFLSQHRITTARVFFQFDAVAARKNVARKPSKLTLSNTTSERKSGFYDVRVRCLAKPARAS
ncbi:MAG: hypothetical protein AAFY73_11550 [Pseudomonadota bacterium]